MQKKLPSAVSEDNFVKLIENTKKEEHKVAFLLGFGSGLRISEVLKLQPNEIDLKEKKIFVRQGKGKKDRVVPVPKGLKEKHIKLFPIKLTPRALQISFKKIALKSGLLEIKPDLHFHSLRHGFGSQLAKQGMPIHHIRTLMGHSNISTTNVYLELNPQDALKKYEELF